MRRRAEKEKKVGKWKKEREGIGIRMARKRDQRAKKKKKIRRGGQGGRMQRREIGLNVEKQTVA